MIIRSDIIMSFVNLFRKDGRKTIGFIIFPFIFMWKKERADDNITIMHEKIHFLQCLECLIIGFYLIYILEFIYFIFYFRGNLHQANMEISFEREAYAYQE